MWQHPAQQAVKECVWSFADNRSAATLTPKLATLKAHASGRLYIKATTNICNMSDQKPQPGDTLVEASLKVLLQADPWLKAEYTYAIHRMWNSGEITVIAPSTPVTAPDRPSRDDSKVPPAAADAAATMQPPERQAP
jgi:hypothetical protein